MILRKDELLQQIAEKANVDITVAQQVVNAFIEVVYENLSKRNRVRLTGFGTWEVRRIGSTRVKSIHDGDEIIIPDHERVFFSIGAVLARVVTKMRNK